MDRQFFLVHGIRSKDKGAASMGVLSKYLNRVYKNIHLVSYGYVLVPINNKKAVNAIISSLDKNKTDESYNIVIAYSNGAWAALQVAELGYKIDHLILISPAVHKYHAIPEQVKRVDIYYSDGDNIVELSKFWRVIANLFPWNWSFIGTPHGWGAMGKHGYVGSDPRVHNHNMGKEVGHFWYKYPLVAKMISQHIISTGK